MGDRIKLLPDHVANQIAAGEVVQRPASVVKELLENAIDAGASKLSLVVKEAGKNLIQLVDDGEGMSPADAELAFARHATSKISSAEDLFSLHTKGFRGEALASIAAIAQVELKSRRETDELGVRLEVAGGQMERPTEVVTPVGTVISVKNLFYNIPARRNFLKSNSVELRHVLDEFHRVALAHPEVALELVHNGNALFNLPVSNMRQRIVNIFGSKTNERLVPVLEETDLVSLSGFVIKPQYARKSRGEQFFFVNDRFVKSPYMHHAVQAAFEGVIKEGTHPGYFLYLQIDPSHIDINIHPTKTEVKFENEHAIYAIMRASIKHSLGQFSVAPTLDFTKESELDTPYEYHRKSPVAPRIEVDRDFNPFGNPKSSSTSGRAAVAHRLETHWEALYSKTEDRENLDQAGEGSTWVEEATELQSELFEAKEEHSGQPTFQWQLRYVVCRVRNGLMFVHQHRAHQRILYERYLHRITIEKAASQQLLFPHRLHFTTTRMSLLEDIREALEQAGFAFGKWEADGLEITGRPAEVDESSLAQLFEELLTDLENDLPGVELSLVDRLAKAMARSLAIRSGVSLSEAEQERLVHDLFGCKEPDRSVDGKSTVFTLERSFIDQKFN